MLLTDTISDNELVSLLKTGSKEAFTLIYNRHWRLIYAHVFKMLRDEDDAKDILQETFSSLWLNAQKIPEQQNLAGYLYVAARHRVLNAMRHQKYHDDYIRELLRYTSQATELIMQSLDEKDLMAAIEHEIAALPPRMRQVFELSRKGHLSHKEISQLLGTSEETVKKQVHKSLKIIRLNLKGAAGCAAMFLLLVTR